MEAERVRAQLERILASAAFADTGRASRFLRFVVERALDRRVGEIKESVIAIEVLGRNSSFDSKTDPIVRVEAGRLRDRLNSYYEGEGQSDSTLISIPKGGYVPEFSERHPSPPVRSIGVLRLSILPPDNARFESFAISPDGRKLAFTAALNGEAMLWVRAMDSLQATPLAGTSNASYPFWSPDCRSIGFFTPNKLKCIEFTGGPARDLADVVVGLGAAWSPEGVIVFCPRPVGVLYQVAASGGTPKPLTSLDEARAEVTHGFPQFLPDGRHFVYLAASSREGESSIRVGSLDSTTSKVLFTSQVGAAYSPAMAGHAGSLLFVSHGALMAQPFDLGRLALSGERTVVVPEVRYRRWHHPGFSVSAKGLLVYQTGCAENQQFAWFDREGKLLKTVGPSNDYISFNLSPDQKHVAFYRDDDPATVYPTIWVMDLSRDGAVFRFTDTGVGEAELTPIWSPDGSEILFSRGDDRAMRLLCRALSGGTPKCILDTQGPKFPSDWSSDRKLVTYCSQVPDYRFMHTWMVSLAGSGTEEKPRPFLQHSYSETSAYFAPANGGTAPRWVAYASDETGRDEIYVTDFPAGSHKWQVSHRGGLIPHWRHDGQELFYLTPDGTLMAVVVNLGATIEFGPPQPLFRTDLRLMPRHKTWMNQYAVVRDGQRFLLNRPVPETAPDAITAVIPW
jgi:Tol biopolymer transport system component